MALSSTDKSSENESKPTSRTIKIVAERHWNLLCSNCNIMHRHLILYKDKTIHYGILKWKYCLWNFSGWMFCSVKKQHHWVETSFLFESYVYHLNYYRWLGHLCLTSSLITVKPGMEWRTLFHTFHYLTGHFHLDFAQWGFRLLRPPCHCKTRGNQTAVSEPQR